MKTARRKQALAVAAILALAAPSAALAGGVSRDRAAAIAKRAASARVESFGISYAPSQWRAACDRISGSRWDCQVGTGGQCSGVITVTGTSVRPRVRKVRISCFG